MYGYAKNATWKPTIEPSIVNAETALDSLGEVVELTLRVLCRRDDAYYVIDQYAATFYDSEYHQHSRGTTIADAAPLDDDEADTFSN